METPVITSRFADRSTGFQSSAPSGEARNVAVVLAHGVGDAEPGYAISTVIATLTRCAGFGRDEEVRVRYLPDEAAGASKHTFPVFIGTGKLATGERLTFAELYWADITRIGPGRVNAMLGLFRVIFESHHFIDAVLDRRTGSGHWLLRHLLLIASWMLRGPIIGLTVNTAAALWATLYILPKSLQWLSEPALFGTVFLGVLVVSAALFIWSWRRRDATWYDPTFWTAVCAATLTAISFGAHVLRIPLPCPTAIPAQAADCRQLHVDQIYVILRYLWAAWGAIMLLSLPLAIAVIWNRRKSASPHATPRVLVALGIVMLQFVLWTAVVGTAVMPFLYRAEEIKGINALKSQYRDLPLQPNDATAQRLFNVVPWDPNQSEWIDRVAFGYGFNAVVILCIMLIGAMTFMRRSRLARKSRSGAVIYAAQLPRIVVGSWILGTLLVVSFLQTLYLPLSTWVWSGTFFEWIADWPFTGQVVTFIQYYKHAILAIGWMSSLALPVLVGAQLSNPVHIARDLLDHQYSPRRASALSAARRRSRDVARYPRRARVQARLERLLNEVVRNGQFDQLILGVHSQGSVIIFDYLNDPDLDNKQLGGLKPDLITCGSPLAHLYQHYFFEYADLQSHITALRNRIGRWINLYRIDDYIGAQIGQLADEIIKNEQLGPGGHTDYWRVEQLGQVIVDLVRRPASDLVGRFTVTHAQ
jgi:hypothetical protein